MAAHQLVAIWQPIPDPRLPEVSERDTDDAFSFYVSDDLAELNRFRGGIESFLLAQATKTETRPATIARFIVFVAPASWAKGQDINWYYGTGHPKLDPLVPKS